LREFEARTTSSSKVYFYVTITGKAVNVNTAYSQLKVLSKFLLHLGGGRQSTAVVGVIALSKTHHVVGSANAV
jgi:hypothetical protein